jgi:RNA polymerase sigma-70 factor, ECF subfamily
LAVKINNEEEFNQLFHRYYNELCKLLMPMLKDEDVVQDVVQDVFVKLWLKREEIEIQTNFKAYLSKAVILRGIEFIRKEKSVNTHKAELRIVQLQSTLHVEETLQGKELQLTVENVMNEMTDSMRSIFHLSRFGGLKNREIAEQLNISIKTVESNISKALKMMHERLRPYLEK